MSAPEPELTTTIPIEAFLERMREEPATKKASPLNDFPSEAVAWLALAPAWPQALAAQGFPGPESGVTTQSPVLAALAAAGLCDVRRTSSVDDAEDAIEYLMSDSQRSVARQYLREQRGLGSEQLRELFRDAAAAMSAAWDAFYVAQIGPAREALGEAGKGLLLLMPRPLARWCQLGKSAESARALADAFLAEVTAALALAKERRATAAPEAVRWIETAEQLAAWFPGPLAAALVTARRRRELFHRNAYDHRLLGNYFQRRAQDEAFRDLLAAPDHEWALHYVGLGGTGKTMLLRHITTDLAGELDLVMARIDFDHLNPDYPERAPALFLDSLAEDLKLQENAGYRTGRSAFDTFDQQVKILHERHGAAADSGRALPATPDPHELETLLPIFCTALAEVAGGRRILLILDTCEELAKIRPDGKLANSVEVTFGVLARIHASLPAQVRVIFSGRRPLASGGPGWTWNGARAEESLPHRDFLRLYEILGFSAGEAGEFLAQYHLTENDEERRVNPALFPAIIAQSPVSAADRPRRFSPPGDAAPAAREEPRFNPYDLDFFAAWSCQEPALTPEKLAGGAHVYVRERIFRRLSRWLPQVAIVVVAGRFDKALLDELLAGAGPQRAQLVSDLIDQEWIDLDRSSKQQDPVWLIEPIMHRRLWKYFREAEPLLLATACANVSASLQRVTLERPWQTLSPGYFEAVLRALHDDPVAAADWWTKVELRIAAEAEWDWARTLTDTLLGEETATFAAQRLRPAILALQAAERTHRAPREAAAIWRNVAECAAQYPTEEGRARLIFRAQAGLLAGLRWLSAEDTGPPNLATKIARLAEAAHAWQRLSGEPDWSKESDSPSLKLQRQASGLAGMEGVGEWAERRFNGGGFVEPDALVEAARFLEECCDFPSKFADFDLAKQWLTRRAQIAFLLGDLETARAVLEEAQRRPTSQEFTMPVDWTPFGITNFGSQRPRAWAEHLRGRWLDWQAPEDPVARFQLEYVRLGHPRFFTAREALEAAQPATPGIETIDADRLASARLALRDAVEVPPPSNLEQVLAPSLALQQCAPVCNAHRAFPLFAIAALEAEAQRGGLNAGVQHLQKIRDAAAGETRLEIQRAADRALVRLAVRFHLTDEPGVTVGASLAESQELEDLTLRTMLKVIEGARSSDALRIPPRNAGEPHSSEFAHLQWLLGERATVGERVPKIDWALDSVRAKSLAVFTPYSEVENELHAKGHAAALTLSIRSLAFRYDHVVPPELIDRLGKRRAAEIALVEGKLMTRRIDAARSAPLLEFASRCFRECSDHVGAFLADLERANGASAAGEGAWSATLEKSYEACREQAGELPTWKKLVAIVDAADASAELDALVSFGHWRPCLVRLVGVLLCEREFKAGKPAGAAAIRKWIGEHYSTMRNDTAVLAPDFTTWVGRPRTAPRWRRIANVAAEVIKSLLGLGILVGMFYGLWKALWWFAAKASSGTEVIVGWRPDQGMLVFLMFVGLIVAGFFRQIVGYLSFPATRLCTISLAIVARDEAIDARAPLRSRLLFRRGAKIFGFMRRLDADTPPDQITGLTRAETTMPAYAELPNFLPRRIAKDLRFLAGLALPAAWQVRLRLDEDAVALPWEAAVGLADRTLVLRDTRFVCRRVLSVAESARLQTVPRPVPVTVWTVEEYLRETAAKTWQAGNDATAFKTALIPASTPGVIHLLGTPQETNLGVVLAFAGAEVGDVLRAEQVIQQATAVQLCILQAPLDEGIDERSEQRRQEAGLLRRFGAALFKSGIPAVLVLPPLTEALHQRVFAILQSALAAPPRQTEREWLGMLRRVQVEVAAAIDNSPPMLPGVAVAEPTPRQVANEVAFDVCLYLVDDFSWHVAAPVSAQEPPAVA